MPTRIPRLLLAIGLTVCPASAGAADEDKSPDVRAVPPADTFLVMPIRVHILTSNMLSDVDCHLTEADVARIFTKVNRVWHHAGIHWGVESIVYEPAARQERFKLRRDAGGAENLAVHRLLFPESLPGFEGLHAYYIHRFPVNGVWLGGREVLVQETARLREVEGGIDEPVPRVTAHELGHALGLPHRQDRTNLLASGTTGTILNAAEVETARSHAVKMYKAKSVDALRADAAEAERLGRESEGRRLRAWMAQIPDDVGIRKE